MGSSTERKQLRAFLSSTFSDFMEERDLLAKQVFPSLRQKARKRGVEVVDVDLRWGITQEQSDRGETLPICLAEIDRCRPYFIALLGDRYGWIPPTDRYSPELLERQPWLKHHQGGTSVTELEILHGVLNAPDMAGRAFFYFRDSAYSDSKQGAGWQSATESERDKLQALKERIRASGFPVVEDLADPHIIAQRIETDLWHLIDQQFPEEDKPTALELEAIRHASYRTDRTGVYLGGEAYIEELEEWIQQGDQRILIIGESGSGKSALIANWVAEHEKSHSEDIVYCHYLGCSNDANSIELLMRRLIDTAAELLEEELEVPQDYWELVAKVSETLSRLSFWAKAKGCRWIWILDGLDKLDYQEALPWLPDTLPDGIHVIASTLDCQVKKILNERNYKELTIDPLQRKEKEKLIDCYLRIFSRQLEGDLKETILAHPLSGSPIFLRTLLEEMRQCGKFRELNDQLTFYLSSKTIDDLFERVLERLEGDVDRESVQKTMTALWASRAGLSESELLEITGLKPLEWAPIDISLQEALSETNNRLVFAHDYMRIAIKDRYLPTDELKKEAHSDLADWFSNGYGDVGALSSERRITELPWQLDKANRREDLREFLIDDVNLFLLNINGNGFEVIDFWKKSRRGDDDELDELIKVNVEKRILDWEEEPKVLFYFIHDLCGILSALGLYRDLKLRLELLSVELGEELFCDVVIKEFNPSQKRIILKYLKNEFSWGFECCNNFLKTLPNFLIEQITKERALIYKKNLEEIGLSVKIINSNKARDRKVSLANHYRFIGNYDLAEMYYLQAFDDNRHECKCLDLDLNRDLAHQEISYRLGLLKSKKGENEEAELKIRNYIDFLKLELGQVNNNPNVISAMGNLAFVYQNLGKNKESEVIYRQCIELEENNRGKEDFNTLLYMSNLAHLYMDNGRYIDAKNLAERCFEIRERLFGKEFIDTLISAGILGNIYRLLGDYQLAENLLWRALNGIDKLYGKESAARHSSYIFLYDLYSESNQSEKLKQLKAQFDYD